MNTIISRIKDFFVKGDKRSLAARRNIAASFGLRAISIFVSLAIVPLTISYVNPVQYGLWLTISSIIAWLGYFDFGIAHGFRNKFTEAMARGDDKTAKELVSTAYITVFLLFSCVCVVFLVVNRFLTWSQLLNLSADYDAELTKVFSVMSVLFCYNMVAKIMTTMLTADQKPAAASVVTTLGQVCSLVTIYIMTKVSEGSLLKLAFAYSGIPCLVVTIATFVVFSMKRYRPYSPSLKCFNKKMIGDIIGLGGKFFFIMLCSFCITQVVNVIIIRILGADAVTEYGVSYRYFGVVSMAFGIITAPFWSAFAEATTKKDYQWMNNTLRRLEQILILLIPLYIILVLAFPFAIKIWIGDSVEYSMSNVIAIAIYSFSMCLSNLYTVLVNGTSKVVLQLIIYACFSIVAIPVMSYLCEKLGIVGIVILPIVVGITQSVFARIQLQKLISQNATGIWNK